MTDRPRVLIGLYSDIYFRNFVETGAFDVFAERYDVFWFTANTVKGTLPARPGFTDLGRAQTNPRGDLLRYHMRWVAIFAGHRRARTLAVKRRYMTFSRLGRLAYTVLGLPGVWPLADRLVETYVGPNRSMERIFDAAQPDVVIFPSQGNDAFALDLMRIARARQVPAVMLNYNWDNMASKGPMRLRPDLLCVWGEDMAQFAQEVHLLRSDQVKIIGAAHFQQYFDPVKMAAAARAAVQDAASPPRVLFAGNSRGHPEAKYLQALEYAIEAGRLPRLRVIFRPHPWRAPRSGEKDFHEYGFRHIEMDPQMAAHFGRGMNTPGRPTDRTFAPSIEYNAQLLHSVEGVITPLSTLALEAALVGVPVLAVNFFEEGWLRHALDQFEHLQRMRREVPGVLICDDETRLIGDTARLLTLRSDPNLPARMREAVRPILYSDPASTYAERLVGVVDEVLQGRAVGVGVRTWRRRTAGAS